MKRFFKNIFSKNKKAKEKLSTESSTEQLTETQILDILGNAICDVGYWSWWATDLPRAVQLEFGGTQLYFPTSDNLQPPSTKIAIQFKDPKSISFLTKQEIQSGNQNWYDDLHNDKMEGPTCSYDYFTFTDKSLMAKIISEAKSIHTIHGYSPSHSSFQSEKYHLAFWAGDYGFAVSSDEIKLLSKNGKVELEQIPAVHADWWSYWQKYWDLKDTKNALPKDYACEVTIPLKKT